MARSIIQAQAASPTFTHVYAALVAIVNTKVSHTIKYQLLSLRDRNFKKSEIQKNLLQFWQLIIFYQFRGQRKEIGRTNKKIPYIVLIESSTSLDIFYIFYIFFGIPHKS